MHISFWLSQTCSVYLQTPNISGSRTTYLAHRARSRLIFTVKHAVLITYLLAYLLQCQCHVTVSALVYDDVRWRLNVRRVLSTSRDTSTSSASTPTFTRRYIHSFIHNSSTIYELFCSVYRCRTMPSCHSHKCLTLTHNSCSLLTCLRRMTQDPFSPVSVRWSVFPHDCWKCYEWIMIFCWRSGPWRKELCVRMWWWSGIPYPAHD